MPEYCQEVVTTFAWFSQACPNSSVAHVRYDGEEWAVCNEHLRMYNAHESVDAANGDHA